MTSAIFFKELSKILNIPSLQYVFIFNFFSKQSAVYFRVYGKHIGIQFSNLYKKLQPTKIQSIIKYLVIVIC